MVAAMELRFAGDREAERVIGAIATSLEDTTELGVILGGYLESSTLERFETESAPDGTPWQQSLRAKEDGGKTLTDRRQLLGSIHSEASNGSVRWGSNKIYARPHQDGVSKNVTVKAHTRTITQAFGRTLPGGLVVNVASFDRMMELPARPFLGINAEDETEMVTLTEEYVLGQAEGEA